MFISFCRKHHPLWLWELGWLPCAFAEELSGLDAWRSELGLSSNFVSSRIKSHIFKGIISVHVWPLYCWLTLNLNKWNTFAKYYLIQQKFCFTDVGLLNWNALMIRVVQYFKKDKKIQWNEMTSFSLKTGILENGVSVVFTMFYFILY